MGSNELGVPGLRARHASQTHREQNTTENNGQEKQNKYKPNPSEETRATDCIASGDKSSSATSGKHDGIDGMFGHRQSTKRKATQIGVEQA